MEINRNHYLAIGVVVLLLGLQLRIVESYTLNDKVSKVISARFTGSSPGAGAILPAAGPSPRKVLHPPVWLGWCLLSVGSVLVLHSLAMKKPGA
jgi:hypothetical protein